VKQVNLPFYWAIVCAPAVPTFEALTSKFCATVPYDLNVSIIKPYIPEIQAKFEQRKV